MRHAVHPLPRLALISLLATLPLADPSTAGETPTAVATQYEREMDKRLMPPATEVQHYGALARQMLQATGIELDHPQYPVLVDRSPQVRAILLLWMAPPTGPVLVGASPVSTGRVGAYEARRGGGRGGYSPVRLLLHATDPEQLEPRPGSVQSKGCIRIPATLDRMLDQYGLLDADYEAAVRSGQSFWVLSPRRTPVAHGGRYLIVVDTERAHRPAWSPAPPAPHRRRTSSPR